MAIYAYKTLNKGPYAILAALAALLGYLIATFDIKEDSAQKIKEDSAQKIKEDSAQKIKEDSAQKIKEDSAHLVLVHIPVFI